MGDDGESTLGAHKMIGGPIQLRLANQHRIYPIGRLENVEVNLGVVKTFADFEVIEVVDAPGHLPCTSGVLMG
jgi:hypothetical protein